MAVAIRVENLSKAYQLGEISTGTVSRDLERWWAKKRGKEDPFLKIGEVNDRTVKGTSDVVWSLRDVNFDIEQGEAVGIIGRNGAGKSTLLKLLSRVTSPTSGIIKAKGRIASLLEVGTGFHPDLTGRENIFLNGAILGMRKKEIIRKFDEIVNFAGVERYIDTPVKRYSSGMYVRLAFAVAAHLDSEILIVDEVLAVGDAEFQNKCLGKMNEVSIGEGRTVLFVSHNLTAINSLCNKCIYLRHGQIIDYGITNKIIQEYSSTETETISQQKWENSTKDGVAYLLSARLINKAGIKIESAHLDEEIGIECIYEVKLEGYMPIPNIHVFNIKGDNIFVSGEATNKQFSKKGIYNSIMWIPANLLNDGRYIVGIAASTMTTAQVHFYEPQALVYDVLEDMETRDNEYRGTIPGIIRPKLQWQTIKLN